jgi:hypothetical protein
MTFAEHPEPGDDFSDALRRRARTFRRARLAVLALVVGYFFLPYDVRAWIPAVLPFLAALALEVHFFLGGYLQSRRDGGLEQASPDRGPQARDLADLGGEHWREVHAVEHAGERHLVPTEGLSEEEAHERIAAYLDDPEAALTDAEPPVADTEEVRHPYRRYLLETAAAVALVAGILFLAARPHGWDAVSTANRARAEAVFSREAAAIAGHPARVSCDTSGEYVGFVQDADGLAIVGGNRAYVTPAICDTLYQLAFKHRVHSFSRTARAVAVLAHESWHLHGVSDEGLANCYGFQSGVGIGLHLGLSESTARAMMREQLATNASDAAGNPAYLVPSGCHDGGSEDLHPAERGFP